MEAFLTHGFRLLAQEALPACSSSTAIFANAPAGTKAVSFTLRTHGLTMSFDSETAATAGGVGQDWPLSAGEPYWLFMTNDELKKIRAIQTASTTTGFLCYWGV